jgi:5-formyltetrahydrofolate cyclo-ligase
MEPNMSARSVLRKESRAQRAAMSARQRLDASLAICRRLRSSELYWGAQHIAFVWPTGPEVDLRELMGSALGHGKRCYLPVMRAESRMWFMRYDSDTRLLVNNYGIPEPDYAPRRSLAPELLDLVCVPLTGFDRSGTRLGAGGGFYDRAFAFKNRDPAGKPRFVGVAYACQEVTGIERAPWDVPLSWVVTEKEIIDCR